VSDIKLWLSSAMTVNLFDDDDDDEKKYQQDCVNYKADHPRMRVFRPS